MTDQVSHPPVEATNPPAKPIPTLPPAFRRRYRAFNWITGSVLWIVVIGALWYMLQNPKAGIGEEPEPAAQQNIWDQKGIEDFELISSENKKITKKDLLGQPWVVSFIFTKCAGPCPMVTAQMKDLHDRLKDEGIRFVTITVDPERDTPEQLAQYAKIMQADTSRWLFLTGDKKAIYALIGDSFKQSVGELTGDQRKPGFEFLHTTNLLLVNDQGQVQGKYNSRVDTDMVRLRQDIRKVVEK